MESLYGVLAQAMAVFGNAAIGEVAKQSVSHAWNGLKALLQRKLGSESEVPTLLDQLRQSSSTSEQDPLLKQLADHKLTDDPEIASALASLSDALANARNMSSTIVQAREITGAGVVHGTLNMTINKS